MTDDNLKQLLSETHPVRPGQEARAWSALEQRMFAQPARASFPALFAGGWVRFAGGALTACAFMAACDLLIAERQHIAMASTTSQSPGIFATAFYSHSAKAQVVWLDGLEPSTDQPTYLDPTTAIAGEAPPVAPSHSTADPNRL